MRLNSYQIEVLKGTAKEIFGPGSALLLFGSRVDDDRRGGDIDLCVTGFDRSTEEQLEAKLRFLVGVERKIGEQRIDVVFAPRPDQSPKPIHRIIERTGVPL